MKRLQRFVGLLVLALFTIYQDLLAMLGMVLVILSTLGALLFGLMWESCFQTTILDEEEHEQKTTDTQSRDRDPAQR